VRASFRSPDKSRDPMWGHCLTLHWTGQSFLPQPQVRDLACAEGRWVHPAKSGAEAHADWDHCKAEVPAGVEHQKDTMAGGINLSGCMQSKGYRYVEEPASR
jgi:hypothetical protein